MVHPDDVTLDNAPHSRACGPRPHPHGAECSHNCPTCHGKAIIHTLPAEYHPGRGTPDPVEQPSDPDPKVNLYDYEHITKERYDSIIENTYRDLHTRVMNGSSQGSPAISLLLDQIRALEAVRAHLFGKPRHRNDDSSSFAEDEAVKQLQRAKFGKMTPWELNKDHKAQPSPRRGSLTQGICEVCNEMCEKLSNGWFHAPNLRS